MCTTAVPDSASASDALGVVESLLAGLAAEDDVAGLPGEVVAERLRALERIDAIAAAIRGRHLAVFDAQDGHLADGQRTARSWMVHCTRITRRQAAEHTEVQVLARSHPLLHAALAEGWVLSTSEALQIARWTRQIPKEYRTKAEDLVVTAARAGADLRDLARICGEIRDRTAKPDPDQRGAKSQRQDHPQPRPATPARVTALPGRGGKGAAGGPAGQEALTGPGRDARLA